MFRRGYRSANVMTTAIVAAPIGGAARLVLTFCGFIRCPCCRFLIVRASSRHRSHLVGLLLSWSEPAGPPDLASRLEEGQPRSVFPRDSGRGRHTRSESASAADLMSYLMPSQRRKTSSQIPGFCRLARHLMSDEGNLRDQFSKSDDGNAMARIDANSLESEIQGGFAA